jgi:hypothetical protein
MMTLDLRALAERDQRIVETALPAHMLFLMMQECTKIGLELRVDTMDQLNNAAAAPLAELDNFSVARLAKRIDDVARSLLNDLAPDDPRHGLYCCAMFALVLVDEGWLRDKGNMSVLVALALMEDIKNDAKDRDGRSAVWGLEERKWRKAAGSMHVRAALQGVFNTRPI